MPDEQVDYTTIKPDWSKRYVSARDAAIEMATNKEDVPKFEETFHMQGAYLIGADTVIALAWETGEVTLYGYANRDPLELFRFILSREAVQLGHN